MRFQLPLLVFLLQHLVNSHCLYEHILLGGSEAPASCHGSPLAVPGLLTVMFTASAHYTAHYFLCCLG